MMQNLELQGLRKCQAKTVASRTPVTPLPMQSRPRRQKTLKRHRKEREGRELHHQGLPQSLHHGLLISKRTALRLKLGRADFDLQAERRVWTKRSLKSWSRNRSRRRRRKRSHRKRRNQARKLSQVSPRE